VLTKIKGAIDGAGDRARKREPFGIDQDIKDERPFKRKR
jgi:hypothetical protein